MLPVSNFYCIFELMNIPKKILIVDDEPDIIEILKYNLELEKFIVYEAKNGIEAIEIAEEFKPELIILDVMMPELDGIQTCLRLRKIPSLENTIIIFLTARSEDYSEIAGFEAGADDYVTKPIRPKALIARVKNLLKRKYREQKTQNVINFKNLKINLEKRLVLLNGIEISLPKKEFQLLQLLANQPEKVFTREEIYLAVWGNKIIVGDRTLDVHIRKLRKKIGENYIKTSKGIGYSFKVINN